MRRELVDCVIGGYHSEGQRQAIHACDYCGQPVCPEHRGLHWERAHRPEEPAVERPL